MKKVYLSVIVLLAAVSSQAQAPQAFSYQAVIRDNLNALVAGKTISERISLIKDSAAGTVVYSELQSVKTNANGLVSLQIGTGSVLSGSFSGINWASGSYFIRTETDPTGGSTYSISNTTQLLSVPFALYAGSSGTAINGIDSIGAILNSSTVKGDSIRNGTLYLSPADSINGGIVSNSTQTFAGSKTFKSNLVVNGLQIGANDTNSVILGYNLGNNQGIESIAIGDWAGQNNQGNYCTAIGNSAGLNSQGQWSVAIGPSAGKDTQGIAATAVGIGTGQNNQGQYSLAAGYYAGYNDQGSEAVALGGGAGLQHQAQYAVAIGRYAGDSAQGQNSIAIGHYAGVQSQPANSIVFDASGNALNPTTSGFFVAPIRGGGATIPLSYNLTTNEITYNTSDIRLKRNIKPINNGLETVMKLNPVSYEKKYSLTDVNYPMKENGFIAQEVQKVLPNLVQEIPGKDKLLALNYIPLIPFMVKSIQELEMENNKLKAQLEKLSTEQEGRIQQLEKLVKQLSNK